MGIFNPAQTRIKEKIMSKVPLLPTRRSVGAASAAVIAVIAVVLAVSGSSPVFCAAGQVHSVSAEWTRIL
jgi:hypothetical protein